MWVAKFNAVRVGPQVLIPAIQATEMSKTSKPLSTILNPSTLTMSMMMAGMGSQHQHERVAKMGELCQSGILHPCFLFWGFFQSYNMIIRAFWIIHSHTWTTHTGCWYIVTGTIPAGLCLSSSAAMVVVSSLVFLAVNGKVGHLFSMLISLWFLATWSSCTWFHKSNSQTDQRRIGPNSNGEWETCRS